MANAINVFSKKVEPQAEKPAELTEAQKAAEQLAIQVAVMDANRPPVTIDASKQPENGYGLKEMSQGVQNILREAALVTREPKARIDIGNAVREDW